MTDDLASGHSGDADAAEATLDIIIVSFNTRALLLQCLASVYQAHWRGALNVFVVDNASTDGSVDAVRERHPNVNIIEPAENLGFAQANNLALEQTTADYVLLLNPDTVLGTDALTSSAEYLKHHAAVGMVTCKLVLPDGSLDLACRRSFPSAWDGFCRATGLSFLFPRSRVFARYNLTYLDEDATYDVDAVNGAFMFCDRRAIETVGPLDRDFFMYAEDLDWCHRFGKAGYKIAYHPVAETIHYKGQSSAPRSAWMLREQFKANSHFYRKHYAPQHHVIRRQLTLLGLEVWKQYALLRNAIRRRKSARP